MNKTNIYGDYKICIKCNMKHASFNYKDLRPKYCKSCSSDEMIDVKKKFCINCVYWTDPQKAKKYYIIIVQDVLDIYFLMIK